jgi:predicted ribosome quality control (RQC) complex YloA/Tae2 family protein
MRFAKVLLDVSAEKLMEKAGDCFDIAKTQHDIADKQHKSADKLDTSANELDTLGHALEADADQLKGKTKIVSARKDTELEAVSVSVPPNPLAPSPSRPFPKAWE